jgi:hypothetical protein
MVMFRNCVNSISVSAQQQISERWQSDNGPKGEAAFGGV